MTCMAAPEQTCIVKVILEHEEAFNLRQHRRNETIFNKMIVVTNAYLSDDMSKTINVDRIELGLMRITDPATRSSGLVIPVWDFFGNVTTAFKNGEKSYSELDDDPLNSVLAINAIDGTLVDRSRGY